MATHPNRGIQGLGNYSYPSAQDTFTDREYFRELLRHAVEAAQKVSEYRVKVIYGAGGQGKSALKEEYFFKMYLDKLQLEDQTLLKVDVLDWEKNPQTRQADEGLLRIAEALINQGVPMPAFCLGFIRYQMLLAPASNLQQAYPFLFKMGQHADGVLGTLTDQLFSTITGSLAEVVAQGVPLVGYFAKQAVSTARQRLTEWLRRTQVKEVLGDLDELSRTKLLDRLPQLLAYDVGQYLRSGLDAPAEYPNKRIIITVDGYEGIWGNDMFNHPDRDAWMRRLVECLPGVLFVFFGRDRLRWADIMENSAYDDILDQHIMQGLSDEDAECFLRQTGIAEADIRLEIVRSAKDRDNPDDGCLPFYLDLQARQYHEMKNNGRQPTPASFGRGGHQSVVNHFYEHLQEPVADSLKQFSLANYLDKEIIELFRTHHFIEPNAVKLPELRHYSFIKERGDKLTMHGLMREMSQRIVLDEFGPHRAHLIQQMLFEYFEAKLQAIRTAGEQELTAAAETLLEQAAYHKQRADASGYTVWVLGHARHFYGQDVHGALLAALGNGEQLLMARKATETDKTNFIYDDFTAEELTDLAELKYWLAQRYHWGERLEPAAQEATTCLLYLGAALPEKPLMQLRKQAANDQPLPSYATRQLQLLIDANCLRAGVRCEQDRYVEAGQDYNDAKKLATDFGLRFDEYTLHKFYGLIGRFSEAEPFIFKTYQQYATRPAEADEKEHELVRALVATDLARTLRLQQRFDEAIRYYDEACALYRHYCGPQHTYTLYAQLGLVSALSQQGTDLVRASALLQEVQDAFDKLYHRNHVNMGHLASRWASLIFRLDRPQVAAQYHQQAIKILGEQLGPSCQPVLRATIEQGLMGQQLNQSGQTAHAFENSPLLLARIMQKKYQEFKNAFSVFSPEFHEGLAVAAEALATHGEYEAAALLAAHRAEYVRIAHSRTAIRLQHFLHEPVAPADLSALLELFSTVLSLPTNPAQVSLQKITLPFYSAWRLYEIQYHNTPQAVRRYVLSDGAHCYCINYKNDAIYAVNQLDVEITADNVVAYAAFFFDACCGRHGFYHFITDPYELPWQVDVQITDEFKASLSAKLQPIKVIAETDTHFVLQAFILFKNALFRAKAIIIHTGPDRGKVYLDEETLLVLRETGEMLVRVPTDDPIKPRYTTLDDVEVPLQYSEQADEQLPLCIDPEYEVSSVAPPTQSGQTPFGQLSLVFRFGTDMLELLLLTYKGEERPDWGQLLAQSKKLLAKLAAQEAIALTELIPPLQKTRELCKLMLENSDFEPDDFRYRNIAAIHRTAEELLRKLPALYQEQADSI
ncbi:MAG: tetratricopeptide repeat protein [Janthinobacterium lividum]